MFVFSWTWLGALFKAAFLVFCVLAGGLEASQIYNTGKHEYTEAPSETTISHDELGMLLFLYLQVGQFVM